MIPSTTNSNTRTSDYLNQIDEAVTFIRGNLKKMSKDVNDLPYQNPTFAIVCGSGLGGLGGSLSNSLEIEYSKIPGFPISTVSGHQGKLVFGLLKDVVTVCMVGRFHFYEGYDLKQVTLPIRVLSRLGVKTILMTNAAGGVDKGFEIGDVMAIEDHISFPNLAGMNALSGPNLDDFGTRFTSLTRIYEKNTFEMLKEAAEMAGFDSKFIKRGVYCSVGGPTYETPAEIRFMRLVGVSAVGMSTVPEVTVAAHCGIERILAFSLITNRCVSHHEDDIVAPTHGEVLESSKMRMEQLEKIVENLVTILYPKQQQQH
jgi:purine-nucleoside phosphorylase